METSSELKGRLQEWLERVRRYLENPPATEVVTRYRVTDPLLDALGYEREEVVPQTGGLLDRYPSYIIMPDSDHTWYLVVEAWDNELDDSDALQALTHARAWRRRFVVLSNGREWRL